MRSSVRVLLDKHETEAAPNAAACRHTAAGWSPTLDCRVCPDCQTLLPGGGNKYHAERTQVDGFWFASRAEAARYQVLRDWERCGEIHDLVLQPAFTLTVAGQRIGTYTPDFIYRETATGRVICEDVKSPATKTEAYGLRKKLLKALHGIEVTEVSA